MFIKVGVVNSQILGTLSSNVISQLKQKLQYEDENQIIARVIARKKYGYIPKSLRWSGITYLIDDKLKFPSGLLFLVEQILLKNKIAYEIIEDFVIPKPNPIELKKLISFWQHQRETIESIKFNKRGIIRAGTGAGKTYSAVGACAEIGQFPFLFLVNRISLLKQAHDVFSEYFNGTIGWIGDGNVSFGLINIATVQTICSMLDIKFNGSDEEDEKLTYSPEQISNLKLLLRECKFLIVDEMHNAASDTYLKVIKNIPKAVYKIGLSATPIRSDGKELLLTASFGDVIYTKTASSLIKEGKLAKPKITIINYKDELSQIYSKKCKAQYQTIQKQCVVENEDFNNMIAKVAITNAKLHRLTLVSVRLINHGENILQQINSIDPDINVVFLNGQNAAKLGLEKIKEDFSNGKIQILISTLFDEGVDIPKIDAVIDGGGGKSPIKTLQLVGRGMRLYPGKKYVYVYSFILNYKYLYEHSLERINTLKTEEEFDIKKLNWSDICKTMK